MEAIASARAMGVEDADHIAGRPLDGLASRQRAWGNRSPQAVRKALSARPDLHEHSQPSRLRLDGCACLRSGTLGRLRLVRQERGPVEKRLLGRVRCLGCLRPSPLPGEARPYRMLSRRVPVSTGGRGCYRFLSDYLTLWFPGRHFAGRTAQFARSRRVQEFRECLQIACPVLSPRSQAFPGTRACSGQDFCRRARSGLKMQEKCILYAAKRRRGTRSGCHSDWSGDLGWAVRRGSGG